MVKLSEEWVSELRRSYVDDPIALNLFNETVNALKNDDCKKLGALSAIADSPKFRGRIVRGGVKYYEDAVGEVASEVDIKCLPDRERAELICDSILDDRDYCKSIIDFMLKEMENLD